MKWSKVVNTCPLCKSRFSLVTHQDGDSKIEKREQQEDEETMLELALGDDDDSDDGSLHGYLDL